MRLYCLPQFLTLVLLLVPYSCAQATLSKDIKPRKITPKAQPSSQPRPDPEKKVQLESFGPTLPESPVTEEAEDPLYPTRAFANSAWTMGGGLWLGQLSERSKTDVVFFYSLMKTNYNLNETAQEFGVQMTTNAMLGGQWSFKWLKGFARGYEWFYKVGVGALYLPSENIGTLINYQRYYLSGAAGFEDLFKLGRRLRGDITGTLSPLGASLQFNLGYVFD